MARGVGDHVVGLERVVGGEDLVAAGSGLVLGFELREVVLVEEPHSVGGGGLGHELRHFLLFRLFFHD